MSWFGLPPPHPNDARAIVIVSAVMASESELTNHMLRFECMREGERWLVLKHEWMGESTPVTRNSN